MCFYRITVKTRRSDVTCSSWWWSSLRKRLRIIKRHALMISTIDWNMRSVFLVIHVLFSNLTLHCLLKCSKICFASSFDFSGWLSMWNPLPQKQYNILWKPIKIFGKINIWKLHAVNTVRYTCIFVYLCKKCFYFVNIKM